VTNGRYRSNTEELDHGSVCRKTGVSPEAEMDVVTGVELECSYGAGDGRTRSGVASMPKERSGGPRLDRSCDWEKYGYDRCELSGSENKFAVWKPHGMLNIYYDYVSECHTPVD